MENEFAYGAFVALLVRHQVLIDLQIDGLNPLYRHHLIHKCLKTVLMIIFIITCPEFEKVSKPRYNTVSVEAHPHRLQLQHV